VTTLADIKRLDAEAAEAMRAASERPSKERAVELAGTEVDLRVQANNLLKANPIRVEHPIFGAGLLNGLFAFGEGAVVLFDDADTVETVQLDLLVEGV
jgi:hypothetical protein